MNDETDLRKRDREARQNSLYSHPRTVAQRADSERKPDPNHIGARHADEKGAMERRHHAESSKLSHDQEVELGKYAGASRPMPRDLHDNHKRARSDLKAKHQADRERLGARHLRERDAHRSAKKG